MKSHYTQQCSPPITLLFLHFYGHCCWLCSTTAVPGERSGRGNEHLAGVWAELFGEHCSPGSSGALTAASRHVRCSKWAESYGIPPAMPGTCAPSMGDPGRGSALCAARDSGCAPVRAYTHEPSACSTFQTCRSSCSSGGTCMWGHSQGAPHSTPPVFVFMLFCGTAGAAHNWHNGVRAKETSSRDGSKAEECSGRSPGAWRTEAHLPMSAVPAAT